MKIGFCAKPDRIEEAARAGFDYLELPVNGIAALTDEAFADLKERVRRAGLPTPSFNLLLPKELSLLAPGTTDGMVEAYLERAFARVEALGGRIAVFGSGRSRVRPEGMSYGDAFRRLVEITSLMDPIAGRHGVTLVVEPLNKTETNMINCLAEGAALAAAVHLPHTRLLADFYHMAVEHEAMDEIVRVGGICHAHIATAEGRCIPLERDERYVRMFAAMKKTGYAGTISIEGRCDALAEEGPRSVALLKQLWEEA